MLKNKNFIAFIIIVVAVILACASLWNDSLIVDEIPHVGAGYSYLVKHEYRLNPEHPPLAKDLAAIPLLFQKIKNNTFDTKYWQSDTNGQWYFGRNLIYQNNADNITRSVKIPMLLFFVLSALLIFKWTDKIYGKRAAIVALTLFAFSPTVLAHSRFVATDMPALFGVLAATYFFIKYLKNPTSKNLIIAGVVFGIAQLLKYSVFLLVPYFLLLGVLYAVLSKKWKYVFGAVLVVVIGYIFVVWPIYGLHVINYSPERQVAETTQILASYGNRSLADTVIFLSDKPFARALAQYGLGFLMVSQRVAGTEPIYFLGDIERGKNLLYFPVVYFLKEPLAFWILVFIALIVFLRSSLLRRNFGGQGKFSRLDIKKWLNRYFVELSLVLWVFIYWVVSIIGNLNIGVRHLLPVYPFTIILVSGFLGKFLKSGLKWASLIIAVLLGWYVFESASVFPYYLTYFNQVGGGSDGGYLRVVDSNIDWGQDLKRLSMWVEENNIKNINLDYFGWADQSYYLDNNFVWINIGDFTSKEDFLEANPGGGYLAVSVTNYMNSRRNLLKSYAWLDLFEPMTKIGNSIFVWHFE